MPQAFETTWNVNNIKAALQRFMSEQGRLPTAREMDSIDYLPTARTIQRRFGGVEQIRISLGFAPIDKAHFGKGQYRSEIAIQVNKRGQGAEAAIKTLLEEKFGEMFVHIERPVGISSKHRLDFYVFTQSGNFGVDVFYPKDTHSMANSMNVKQRGYKNYVQNLYLIIANEEISQIQIDRMVINKLNRFTKNYKVMTINTFKDEIQRMSRYTVINEGSAFN